MLNNKKIPKLWYLISALSFIALLVFQMKSLNDEIQAQNNRLLNEVAKQESKLILKSQNRYDTLETVFQLLENRIRDYLSENSRLDPLVVYLEGLNNRSLKNVDMSLFLLEFNQQTSKYDLLLGSERSIKTNISQIKGNLVELEYIQNSNRLEYLKLESIETNNIKLYLGLVAESNIKPSLLYEDASRLVHVNKIGEITELNSFGEATVVTSRDSLDLEQSNAPILYSDLFYFHSTKQGYKTYHYEILNLPNLQGELYLLTSITPHVKNLRKSMFLKAFQLLAFALFVLLIYVSYKHYLNVKQSNYIDTLTKLWNRKHFNEFTSYICSLEKRSKMNSIGFLAIDIDKFKRINDTYGHHIGDEVLIKLAKTMQKKSRESDVIYRLGGEEFCIICPNEERESLCSFAERLRVDIQNDHEVKKIVKEGYTVSIGVTIKHKNELIEDTMKRADTLLYKAKNNGRNQIQHDLD